MSEVEYSRQSEVFKQASFKKSIDIIGVGATGSHVAYTLGKMGIKSMRVFDFDTVMTHNIPNQLFRLQDVGKPKVVALKDCIKDLCDIDIDVNDMKIDEKSDYTPGNIVFLLTDSMASRREIFDNFLKNRPLDMVIETRMGIDSGRVYTFKPFKPSHIAAWDATLCDDKDAEVSACGTSISIACTAINIASLAVWQMLRAFNGEEVENEIIYSFKPFSVISNKWKA